VSGDVTSPTFTIVHEYEGKAKFYHFDLYRLKETDELYPIGFDAYLEEEAYVFIEWPEIALSLLDDPYVIVDIQSGDSGGRVITCRTANNY
jgi:tRNA threonylcarbamoyladenosine biosynthesis protein TsaE